MLTATLRRDVRHRAFKHLQQRLLNTFTAHIARDRDVAAGFADLVDLIDVDDPALRGLQIVIRILQKLEQDVFDVFTDVPGFGERGGIADGEWHIQNPRQRFGQQGFAAAGGADEQDVALVDFDIGVFIDSLVLCGGLIFGGLAAEIQPFVVVVDGDGQAFFGEVLSDDILIEEFLDLSRRGNRRKRRGGRGRHLPLFLADDVVGQVHAIGADVYVARAFDHGADVTRGFAAKAASGHASTSITALGTVGPMGPGIGTTSAARRISAAVAATGAIGTRHCSPSFEPSNDFGRVKFSPGPWRWRNASA